MRASRALLALLGYSALATADPITITIGDKASYTHTGTAAATPTGDNIALEGTGDLQDGVDIYLSSEIQEKIKNIVKSDCDKELNSKCYNEVQDLFDEPETGLMARNPVLIGLGIVGGLGAVLFPALYKETQPSVIHVPMRELNQATQIPKATQIVVKPEHGDFITIDPSPQPTATGTATVTTYAAASTDHAKGDMGIIIPKGLAKELNDYLDKESVKQCKDSDHFKQKLQRRLSSLGAPVCPTEMLSANDAIMDWVVNIAPTKISAVLRNDDARRAMNTAIAFIRDTAPLLALSPEQAESAATMLYYLVYVKTVYNEAIGTVNIIHADDIDTNDKGQTTTETCSSKTTATNCDVACDMAGPIIGCTTTCSETSACSKTTGTITTTKVEAYTPPVITASATSTAIPRPLCNVDEISGFPANLFKDGVYSKFCSGLKDFKADQSWTVDASGQKETTKKRDVDFDLVERTPPTSAKNYEGYNVTLHFKPHKTEKKCLTSCDKAYYSIAQGQCGSAAAEMNIMASEGTIDVGCGNYSYSIAAPKPTATKPEIAPKPTTTRSSGKQGKTVCHKGKSAGIVGRHMTDLALTCVSQPEKGKPETISEGQDPIEFEYDSVKFTVSWVDGCTDTKQNWVVPKGGNPNKTPLKDTCWHFFMAPWEDCHEKKSSGGYVENGCVKYEWSRK